MAEVIVLGAGAAGLAAAAALARAGRSVLILEARERIGGRCWTRRFPGVRTPVELGAEFIHGEARETYALLRRAGQAAVPSGRLQRHGTSAGLRPVDAFAEARKAMSAAAPHADVSFAAFLASQRGLSPRTRLFARMMVEGFDAADPARASARSIIEEWGGAAMSGRQPRPRDGYDALLGWLASQALAGGARLKLGACVSELRHGSRGVQVLGRFAGTPFSYAARRALVTLPLGVLQAGDVRFRPALDDKAEALRRLESGPVIKMALRFGAPFWERRSRTAAFFHSPAAAFPTFWNLLPAHAPVLVAWAGGPKAQRMAGQAPAALLRAALTSLRTLFGPVADPDAVALHDWRSDPFARGAYSYERVGGQGARRQLARPAGRLHFAGEATDWEGESGTVSGALRSGIRAAREILGA